MKDILLPVVASLFLFVQCRSSGQSEQKTMSAPREPFSGLYQVRLMDGEQLIEEELDSTDFGGKLILSFASLLKVRMNFQDNGYVKFEGEFGYFDWGKDDQHDSTRYWTKGNRLYLDSAEINGKNHLPYTVKNDSIYLQTDSLHILLAPVSS